MPDGFHRRKGRELIDGPGGLDDRSTSPGNRELHIHTTAIMGPVQARSPGEPQMNGG
ncbi:MAG: hypothetical protein AAGF95_09015 [Chloroflexota bacterium]